MLASELASNLLALVEECGDIQVKIPSPWSAAFEIVDVQHLWLYDGKHVELG